jgi:geranylgeranyl pyrophosphate synthase
VDAELAAIAAAVADGSAAGRAVRYALGSEGKRLRPALFLAAVDVAYAARGETVPEPPDGRARPWVRAAAAVELVHTYSLVHDDLPCMDNDALRRGRPTTHIACGTAAAMVAGFALVPLAARTLVLAAADLDLPPARAAAAVRELCRGAGPGGMVGGQVLDLDAEGRDLDLDGLCRIHALKTGALFRAALRSGGSLAGADTRMLDAMGEFGAALGIAFQITDDVLDETTDAATLGKTPGKDRHAGKPSFPALLGRAAASAAADAMAARAVRVLQDAGIESRLLEELAGFAVYRDR